MSPEEQQALVAYSREIAKILHRNAPKKEMKTFEEIEKTIRGQLLKYVNPEIAVFFVETETGVKKGRERKIISCLGVLSLKIAQLAKLGTEKYQRLSPLMTKYCLRLSANESYQGAEEELEALIGIKISYSTCQRVVQRTAYEQPIAKQKVTQIIVDGGNVRVITPKKGEGSRWLGYKSAVVEGMYYGATFQANEELTDWLENQSLCAAVACLGDGHEGVWNIFAQVGRVSQGLEILDWYHLKENLYKIGGSLK